MARLQILELPSGSDDERPPFLLVLDQVAPEMVEAICAAERTTAELIGARAIFSFAETIEIPANQVGATAEPLLRVGEPAGADDAERAGITQIVYAHERTRLDLCDALLLSRDTTWRQLVNVASGLRKGRDARAAALDRVRNLPEHPDIMDARHEQPQGYLHGYSMAIGDAKRAARSQATRNSEDDE